jgi:chromosome segregation ATPase
MKATVDMHDERAERAEAEVAKLRDSESRLIDYTAKLRTQLAAAEKERDEAIKHNKHLDGLNARQADSINKRDEEVAALSEEATKLAAECEGLRELLGEALSVLRGEWSILGMIHCAEKIRKALSAAGGRG